jgi:hypothetical protein
MTKMSVFEIYTKAITIKTAGGDREFKLRPLSGRHLPKLYKVMKVFMAEDVDERLPEAEKNRQFFDKLAEDTIVDLHSMLVETLVKSYPQDSKEEIDEFVSQNLIALLPALIEVNFNNKA